MNRHTRLVLQFFLPPLLAALPLAIRAAIAANKGGDYNPTIMFLAFCGVGFATAAIPSFIAVLLFDAAVAFGVNPHKKAPVAAWAIGGVLLGFLVSKAIAPSLALGYVAAVYTLAWGSAATLIIVLERRALKNRANQLPDPTSPSVTPAAGATGAPSVAADH